MAPRPLLFVGIGEPLRLPEMTRAEMRANWDRCLCAAMGLPDPRSKGPAGQAGRRRRSAGTKAADAWDRAMAAARSSAGS